MAFMKRLLAALLIAAASCLAEEELPSAESIRALEIEPPMLIPPRTVAADPLPEPAPGAEEIAKLEQDLARAERNAGSGERMFRAGMISKQESEERVLRVVRLQARLAAARLEAARTKLAAEKAQGQMVEIEARLRAEEGRVAEAARAAEAAAREKHQAELAAAARNLERQQKLRRLGSARSSDVARAEKRLAELRAAAE